MTQEHDDDCATQCGFSGENSDVTTHPCTCKKMEEKITGTPKEIVDALNRAAKNIPISSRPVWDQLIPHFTEALKSLPTLKDELVKYDMTVDKNIPEDEHNDFPNLKKQCEHRVSAYLATHSKQG